MGEYDAVWVFFISLAFVGFYIFIEVRPKGSNLLEISLILLADSLEKGDVQTQFKSKSCITYPINTNCWKFCVCKYWN